MDLSPESLQQHYADLSDGALLDLAEQQDNLTTEAHAVLLRELQHRDLSLPEHATQAEAGDQDPAVPWVTVERFRDLSGAIVARGALESAGIRCFLRDENTVRLDWQISNLIGGMRLQVQQQDREAALTLLNQLSSGAAPGEADALPAGDLCPFCASPEIHREEHGVGLRAAALWIFAVPLPRGSRYWQCDTCGKQFTDADLDRSESC